ncbi:hypothetical protein OIU85_030040 [Salix viminalis]|uniref:Uncharacterized protein n=1 Tax=Salix viminalis TaxID=40686 RepID=A0A9Q0QD39_SALVM|nr:hypothetical protein OIU85_030040 [Salix viminalis]
MKSLKKVWLSDYKYFWGNPIITGLGLANDNNSNNVTKTVTGFITLAVLLVSIIAVIIFRLRRRDVDFDEIGNRSKGNIAAELEVRVSFSNTPKEMEVA